MLNQYNWSKEERFAYDQTKKHIDDYLSSIQQGKIEGKIIVKCTGLSISEIAELSVNGYGFSSPPCCIEKSLDSNLHDNVEYLLLSSQWDLLFHFINSLFCSIKQF